MTPFQTLFPAVLCVVEFIFSEMCQIWFWLFFCRYLLTEDELPNQENRGICAFPWMLSTAGRHTHLGQNLSHGNIETAQNI